jgi:hypothetical protein
MFAYVVLALPTNQHHLEIELRAEKEYSDGITEAGKLGKGGSGGSRYAPE